MTPNVLTPKVPEWVFNVLADPALPKVRPCGWGISDLQGKLSNVEAQE